MLTNRLFGVLSIFFGLLQTILENPGCSLEGVRSQMAISLRHGHVGMTQDFLDNIKVNSLCNQPACVRMPQGVSNTQLVEAGQEQHHVLLAHLQSRPGRPGSGPGRRRHSARAGVAGRGTGAGDGLTLMAASSMRRLAGIIPCRRSIGRRRGVEPNRPSGCAPSIPGTGWCGRRRRCCT